MPMAIGFIGHRLFIQEIMHNSVFHCKAET